jgi:RimJ/RimL family protein N-acetyltransferase
MAFGPRMKLKVDGLDIELAPLTKEVLSEFVEGMQQFDVTRFLSRQASPTLEDEQEWYDKIRAEKDSCSWGIWVVEPDSRILIGTTALLRISRAHIHQATSGSMIFRKEYWKRGIASHIHKARTWYAFQHLGLHKINSEVIQGNIGSRKALEKTGYELVYVRRNAEFVDGSLRHVDMLECINPIDSFWTQWWHDSPPTDEGVAAQIRAKEAMDWAEQHVSLS